MERENEKGYHIANQNTTGRRHKRDAKATLQPLQVGDRVLVRNLTPREGCVKLKSFWEQKVYIIEEVKDPDSLVYTVKELDKPNSKSRTLHSNNIMSCHNLSHIDQYSTTRKDTVSPRKYHKQKNKEYMTEESKISNDEEKSSSSDEENEIVDHIRNLRYKGIGPGKVRSRRLQEVTHTLIREYKKVKKMRSQSHKESRQCHCRDRKNSV